MNALLGKELLVIIPGNQLKRDPHKEGIDLFALGELDGGLHRSPPLSLRVLEDSHS